MVRRAPAAKALLLPVMQYFGRPEQHVSRLQNFAAQPTRIIWIFLQKLRNDFGCFRGLVAAERCVEPAFWKENISGALNFFQQIQAGPQIVARHLSAQRVV